MARNYPHISDTAFPILDNVNPYKYENDFDYAQYDKTQMRITVCTVPWDVGLIHVGNAQIGGLGNVVDFETKAARDAWFDGLEDAYTWQTKYRKYHTDGYIEVPLPYEKAVLYNYVYVEYDRLLVDYSEGGKDRFFFFIRACESLAPSTCRIEILRDTWQTYIYDIDIAYMMLERGHAPMALTDASRYLQNPIENCAYLLGDDVNYGTTYVSRRASEIVLNAGEMWACVVTSANALGGFGVLEQDNARTPNGLHMQDGQPSLHCYALAPETLSDFLRDMESQLPWFLQTVKAVFFVKRSLVRVTAWATLEGYQLGILAQANAELSLVSLNQALFGYGEDYRSLAKLYTYPYAYLEISDEAGNVDIVRIEETTGDVSLSVTTSLAYPWLAIDGRIRGIGTGSADVAFSNVNQHSFSFGGDWFNHLKRWSIPTFAITVSAADVYRFDSYYDRKQRELELETALGNSVRSANTAKANADASADTDYVNSEESASTTRANTEASAQTSRENSDDSAALQKSNADNDAGTSLMNANANALTSKLNVDALALASRTDRVNASQTALDNTEDLNQATLDNAADARGTATILNVNAQSYASRKLDEYDLKAESDSWRDISTSAIQAALEADLVLATNVINSAQDAIGGAVSGAQNGALAGAAVGVPGAAIGALAGAGASVIGSSASAAFAAASYALLVTNNDAQFRANTTNILEKTRYATRFTRNTTEIELEHEENTVQLNNALNQATAQRSARASNDAASATHDTETANADRDKATSDANAQRSYDTAIAANQRSYDTTVGNASDTYDTQTSNAERTHNTANENAFRTQSTALANATRSRDTEKANAVRTRDTALANALDTYNAGIEGLENDKRQAGLKAPYIFGESANGETSATRPQGLFCNIVTQTKDAIEQAGDYFLRFGYAVNRAWRFEGFNAMPRFTYWKCADIWVSGNSVPDAYMDEIRFFLLGGVCVWRNPEDIGRISIYENR